MKTQIRVTNFLEREIPVHRYVFSVEQNKHVKSGELVEVLKVKRETRMFKGSEPAYRAWADAHEIPPTAKIEWLTLPENPPRPVRKIEREASFAQDSIFLS